MRKIILSLLILPSLCLFADNKVDAYKAMVNIIAYDANDAVLHSGYGFYVAEDGTIVAPFQLLKGAQKADAIDYKGNKYQVERILGANSTHDLVKFRISAPKKKVSFLKTGETAAAPQMPLSLVRYTNKKKEALLPVSVQSASDYDSYKYYDLSAANDDSYQGCPLVNEDGNVLAIVQKNVVKDATTACAIDARFINELTISSTSALNADLRSIHIQKAIPEDQQAALTYIYMMGRNDSTAVVTAMNDFIAAFPDNIDIYVENGSFYASRGDTKRSEAAFQTALKMCEKSDNKSKEADVRHSLSKLIYAKAITTSEPGEWNITRALDEAKLSCAADTNSLYRMQLGHCHFVAKNYRDAYDAFMSVCNSWLATPETYWAASRALKMEGSDSLRVLALLDSAIVRIPQPYTTASARYFLERANQRVQVRLYRDAVWDYNEYEKIIGPKNLNDKFYYLRSQAELQAKMYQQALDDLRTAYSRAPENHSYKLEEALLLVRVGHYEEAALVIENLLPHYPEDALCHKILGIAYGELHQTDKAIQHLKKAEALGDTDAINYLNKYNSK